MSGKEREQGRRERGGRSLRRWLWRLACAVLLLWLAAELAQSAAAFDRSRGIQVIRLSQAGSAAEIQRLREHWEEENEGEVLPAVFWREQKSVRVQNESWNRSASVTELAVCGSSGLLYPGQAFLSEEDREGCLIDRETSWRLFGDAAAIGSLVECQGELYQVRGVLQESAPVLVRMAREGEAFSCLAVQEDERGDVWEKLRNAGGLSGRQSVCYAWELRWLKAEGEAGEKLREILYGENNVLEIRYLELAAGMALKMAGMALAAALGVHSCFGGRRE